MSIVRPVIGYLSNGRRVFILEPELVKPDHVVKYWVRRDLAKSVKNFQWRPPNYLYLSDQSPISYEVLKNEYLDYKVVGLPETVTAYASEAATGPRVTPFHDVPVENRCVALPVPEHH